MATADDVSRAFGRDLGAGVRRTTRLLGFGGSTGLATALNRAIIEHRSGWLLALNWGIGLFCVAGAVVALATVRSWGSRVPTRLLRGLAWLGSLLLAARALDIYVEVGRNLTGITSVPADQRGKYLCLARWFLFLRLPWFALGAVIWGRWPASSTSTMPIQPRQLDLARRRLPHRAPLRPAPVGSRPERDDLGQFPRQRLRSKPCHRSSYRQGPSTTRTPAAAARWFAAGRGGHGRLALAPGRPRAVRGPPLCGPDPAARRPPAAHARRRRPVTPRHRPAPGRVPGRPGPARGHLGRQRLRPVPAHRRRAPGTDRAAGHLLLRSLRQLPPGLPGRALALAGRLPGGLNALVQPLRLPAQRRLPVAFGWMAKRPIPRQVTDAWLAPLMTTPVVRRDLAKYLRAAAREPDVMVAAAEGLRGFDRPALIVWATEDRIMPPKHGQRLARVLPQGRLVELADSYTLLPEDQPAELARTIRQFIKATATSAT